MVVVVQGPCCLPLIFLEPKWPSSSLGFVVLLGEGSRSSDAVRSFESVEIGKKSAEIGLRSVCTWFAPVSLALLAFGPQGKIQPLLHGHPFQLL